jgi:CheY-like chemotaxis protein
MEAIEFKLDEVMNNIAGMVSIKASEKGLELLNVIAEDVPNALVGDPLRLGQVLTNLANNATKFTEHGHILMKAELLDKNETCCKIKFIVRDTGIGMSQEQLDKLFKAFSQADSSITRKYGGSGLGLTISQSLVEMMDGEISVESKPDHGSTFAFTATFKRQLTDGQQRYRHQSDLTGLKVLVVDDNELAREVLKEQLAWFKIEAVTVNSGKAAIKELENASGNPYDLVMMDWNMPEMNGIEASKIIKKHQNLEHVPFIIMVTAFGREEILKNAGKSGINAFLIKPINQSLLFDTIMQAFGRNISDAKLKRQSDKSDKEIWTELAGLKVLLVEDVAINQQVATEILEGAGVIVDIADNGKEAVEAVTEREYDIVLMDIQMPVMGGFEATARIRADSKNDSLPIIAMTAHAIQGTREECLKTGMNDYVSKPIDSEQLFEVLRKWFKPADTDKRNSIGVPYKQPDNEVMEVALPDTLPGVDMEAGLKRINRNHKLFRVLLLDFSKMFATVHQDIRHAIIAEDFESAQSLAHKLKGVAGNISAKRIHGIASDLETEIKKNNSILLEQRLLQLEAEIKPLLEAIKQLEKSQVATDIPDHHKTVDENTLNEIAAVLTELEKQVLENSFMAGNTFEKLVELAGDYMLDEFKLLGESIDSFDFEGAIKIILRIDADLKK